VKWLGAEIRPVEASGGDVGENDPLGAGWGGGRWSVAAEVDRDRRVFVDTLRQRVKGGERVDAAGLTGGTGALRQLLLRWYGDCDPLPVEDGFEVVG